jgi:arylsulfatase A-like enzyme/Flp pilus assembly protein TadD
MSKRSRSSRRALAARQTPTPRSAPRAEPSPAKRGIRAWIVLVLLTAAVTALGAGWWWCGSRAATAVAFRETPDQNVLLITIDTLRADALRLYGGPAASPNLEALARHGRRFDFAHAHTVVTLPSHTSILTGLYPYQHAVRDNAGYRLRHTSTLATWLKAAGYLTGAFVGAFPLDSRFGLDTGFDVYDDRFGETRGPLQFSFAERRAEDVIAPAREWIAAQRGRWFAWVHVFDPHAPYRPPPPFDRDYAGRPYYGEVAYIDHALGPLLESMSHAVRPTLAIVTGDHGEGLGDHGEETHGIFAYESTLRIPLVIAQVTPGVRGASEPPSSPASVRHVDIVPTVLAATGLARPRGLPGRSLIAAIRGTDSDRGEPDSYFEAMSGMLNRGWAPLTGVLVDHQKFVNVPIAELYDLARDPGERDNLAGRLPTVRRSLDTRLAAFRAGLPGEPTMEDHTVLAGLRALGYVSGAVLRKTSYTEADDPKRLIQIDRELRHGIGLIEAGRLAEAEPVYRHITSERPDMLIAYRHLGFLLWSLGRPGDAIAVMNQALARTPRDEGLRTQLANYLAEAGQASAAIALLEPNRTSDDPEALNALGIAYARVGRRQDAFATFTRVLTIDARNAMALQNLGSLHLEQREWADARAAFSRALDVDPALAATHTGLGVVELETGNRSAAFDHWRRAIELDPTDFNALYDLAVELARDGRMEAARPYAERFVRTAPPALFADDIRRVEGLLRGSGGP